MDTVSFDLININSFVISFIVIAGLTTLLAFGSVVEFLATNRKVRLARRLTIPSYYGNLLGAH